MAQSSGSLPSIGLSAASRVMVTRAGKDWGSSQRARLGQDILRTGDEAGQGIHNIKEIMLRRVELS